MSLPKLLSLRLLNGIADYSPIAGLTDLQHLQFSSDARHPLDLTTLTRLRTLEAPHAVCAASLSALINLEELIVVDWPTGNFEVLGAKPSLTWLRVELRRRALVASTGLAALSNLTRLTLCNGRLQDVNDVAFLQRLVWFEVHGTKVSSLAFSSSLAVLQKLEIEDGGTLASLRPLSKHPSISTVILAGSTSVADGDLDVLWEMPALSGVALTHKSHYNRMSAEVAQSFSLPH
jgi:hypothetical protein